MTNREKLSQSSRTIKRSQLGNFVAVSASLVLLVSVIPTVVIYRTDLAFSYTDEAVQYIKNSRFMPLKVVSSTIVYEDDEEIGVGATPEGALRNEDVFKKLSESKFADKADTLAIVYAKFEPSFSRAQVLGIMANIYAEGNLGLVQFGCNAGFGYSSAANRRIIRTPEDLKGFEQHVASGNGSVGIGICQWTTNDRKALLLSNYKKYLKGKQFDDTMILQAEMDTIDAELHSTYSLSTSDDPSTCAYSFCVDYEKPASMYTAAVIRAGYAKEMDAILK